MKVIDFQVNGFSHLTRNSPENKKHNERKKHCYSILRMVTETGQCQRKRYLTEINDNQFLQGKIINQPNYGRDFSTN